MATANPPDLASLYLADETAWLDAMAELARSGRPDQLDLANLAEFLQSMAERDRREVTSRLAVLLAHLLKWTHQPEKRSKSWTRTILTQQQELDGLFENATLRSHGTAALAKAYGRAVRQASIETDLPEATFPAGCPYTLDAALAFRPENDPG